MTARTVQGMVRVRPGRLLPDPYLLVRSVRRGSRVKRDFACTFTRHLSPVLVVLRSQSRLRLEGRTRTLSGPSPDLSPPRLFHLLPGARPAYYAVLRRAVCQPEKRKVDSSVLSLTTSFGLATSALTSANAAWVLLCLSPSSDHDCPCVTAVDRSLSHADRTPCLRALGLRPLRPELAVALVLTSRPSVFQAGYIPKSPGHVRTCGAAAVDQCQPSAAGVAVTVAVSRGSSSGLQESAWLTLRAIVQRMPCDKDWHMGWKLPALAVMLWVIALTMVGVAVGQVIGGPEGALIGAIPGALAAVLAGFVPAIVDTARRRREEQAQQEQEAAAAQAKWDMIGEPVGHH